MFITFHPASQTHSVFSSDLHRLPVQSLIDTPLWQVSMEPSRLLRHCNCIIGFCGFFCSGVQTQRLEFQFQGLSVYVWKTKNSCCIPHCNQKLTSFLRIILCNKMSANSNNTSTGNWTAMLNSFTYKLQSLWVTVLKKLQLLNALYCCKLVIIVH